MRFKNLLQCVEFLEKQGELIRIKEMVDPDLEMAEIHKRVFNAKGPAILFENVKATPFPALSNLFGTYERALKIFEPELTRVKSLVSLKSDPASFIKSPVKGFKALPSLINALPLKVKQGPVLQNRGKISDLPMIRCWPEDGGAFILLPQVFSCDPDDSGIMKSNLGMYRIQISGGEYIKNREIGIHYQLHRGIGNHHAKALKRGEPLKVSIFVGGPPAHTLAAVMPLPEGMPELSFAGALAGKRFRYCKRGGHVISADADFCITGRIVQGKTKKEGPFGDHLGYYSLEHDFPYLEVESLFYRKDAIWPFTVVGRPPQEDSVFGKLIHEITRPAVSVTIPGVTAIHAVDAAGVHPLLLAKARERYVPYGEKKPRELLTHASAILGSGQLSLAKYLLVAAHDDKPELDISNEMEFFVHFFERIDFSTDLHFHTCTTMDTLDYSSKGLNQGSKLVMVAAGEKKRELLKEKSGEIVINGHFSHVSLAGPGMLVIKGPLFIDYKKAVKEMELLARSFAGQKIMEHIPLVVVVDDSLYASSDFSTFLWTTFSRSNPSHDIYGAESFTKFKHWGCSSPLIIDARVKTFHAPPLISDKNVVKRVEKLGLRKGPLFGII
ncbi:MAG: UbiD family decarboxylase [Thermodesulfobacteriota bacterium]|nr:UbiD family decarboxylase [Thermodesulfobacteriota bacterium]